MLLLAGDIGGTKTKLATFSSEGGALAPIFERTYSSTEFSTFEDLVTIFMSNINERVEYACFGIAGPVVQGRSRLTNLPWVIDESELSETFDFTTVKLLNDLQATAYQVPFLNDGDLLRLNEGEPHRNGAIAVIAPGTGLGEAFMAWDGRHYVPFASEGGHADYAPTNPTEVEMLGYLRRKFGHVSYERVCSGKGLYNIYCFFHDAGGIPASQYSSGASCSIFEETLRAEDPTPLIIQALSQDDHDCNNCSRTLDTFISILGAESANFALKVLAMGGVYIGGGLPPRILPALIKGRFMESFLNKGRMSSLVSRMPVHIVLNSQTALLGAARYGLDLTGYELEPQAEVVKDRREFGRPDRI